MAEDPNPLINSRPRKQIGILLKNNLVYTSRDCNVRDTKELFGEDVKFTKNSGNAVHYINGRDLYKVQIQSDADNIVAEACILKLINRFENEKGGDALFPMFKSGGVVQGSIRYIDELNGNREVQGSGKCRYLQMEAFANCISLNQHIHESRDKLDTLYRNHYQLTTSYQLYSKGINNAQAQSSSSLNATMKEHKDFLNKIHMKINDLYGQYQKALQDYYAIYFELQAFMTSFVQVSIPLKMSHNDLSRYNILVSRENKKWHVIDVGRLYIDGIKNEEILRDKDIQDILKLFCVVPSTSLFVNGFHIEGKYHYLCDLFTLSLNVLPHLTYFTWPAWCLRNDNQSYSFRLSYSLLNTECYDRKMAGQGNSDVDMIYYVLAWFICCVYGFAFYRHAIQTKYPFTTSRPDYELHNAVNAMKVNVQRQKMNVNVAEELPDDPSEMPEIDKIVYEKEIEEYDELIKDPNLTGVLYQSIDDFNLNHNFILNSSLAVDSTWFSKYRKIAEGLFDHLGLKNPFVGERGFNS